MTLLHRSAPVVAAVLLAACGAGPGADATPAVTVLDSAGIRIVSSHAPAWRPDEAWTLSPDPLFVIPAAGDADPDGPVDPTSISVDPRGRIIIGDGDQGGRDAILVYDSTGKRLFITAGAGQGPGEFRQLWWASAYRGDSIAAFDMGGDVVRVFDPEGAYARQLTLPAIPAPRPPPGTYGYTAGIDLALPDGSFIGYPGGAVDLSPGPGVVWSRQALVRLDPEGEGWTALDTVGIYQQYWDGERAGEYWFGAFRVMAAGPDGVYYGDGDSWELAHYGPEGSIDRIIRRTSEPEPVTAAWKAGLEEWYFGMVSSSPEGGPAMVEQLRQRFATAHWAPALPPYSAALVDTEGHLWVENFRWIGGVQRSAFGDPTIWSVFDPEGTWLGDVEVPPHFVLQTVTRDRALGFHLDEFDVAEAHVYALQRR